jgi:hypothetical protein
VHYPEDCQNDSNTAGGTVKNGARKYFWLSRPPLAALKIATFKGPRVAILRNACSIHHSERVGATSPTPSSLLRSVAIPVAWPPLCLIWPASSSNLDWVRESRTTWYNALNCFARAKPSPGPTPAITAIAAISYAQYERITFGHSVVCTKVDGERVGLGDASYVPRPG